MRKPRLNVQGLARREKLLLGNIIPDEGYTFVSIDLAAGEPSVTSHYSQDKNYTYACFDGVGKEPYYNSEGLLMCDDIYIMNMSKSPLHAELIRKTYDTYEYEGRNFKQQWLVDKEQITKRTVGKARDMEKALCLALGYSLKPKGMVEQCTEKGFDLSLPQAKRFYDSYWETFSGVRKFADKCALMIKKNGYIVNDFGYRLTCTPRLAFNYTIQSSVSGIMNVLVQKLFSQAPYARLMSIIHDELLVECPTELIDKFKRDLDIATASLNEDLNWRVAIRVGFAPGHTLYHAK